MKNLSYLLVALGAFVAGYAVHPMLNNAAHTAINTAQPTPFIGTPVAHTDGPSLQLHAKTARETQNSPVVATSTAPVAELANNKALSDVRTSSADTTTLASDVAQYADVELSNEEREELRQDLQQWSASHTDDLNELITAHMSGSAAKHLQTQILENNTLLSEPPIKQDGANDLNWSYDMEQHLRDVIGELASDGQLELLSLSCKQLVCDVLGLEQEPHAWLKIYINILHSVPNVIRSNDSSEFTPISYLDGDVQVLYDQIRFSKAAN